VLGFVDEIVLLPFAIVLAVKLVPENVMTECRARAAESGRVKTPAARVAAVLIVLLWIVAIVVAGRWVYRAIGD
jgi:uncharacterized membrane protein YkvA (DUF1232 family)